MKKPMDYIEDDLSKFCIKRRSYFGDYRQVRKLLLEKGFKMIRASKTSNRITTSSNPMTKSPLCLIEDYSGVKFDSSSVVSVYTTIQDKEKKTNIREIWELREE